MQFKDNFGRTIDSLRISVTDRCNFRCSYCMPLKDVKWFPHDEILRYEEFKRIVSIFANLGVSKVKITGGEPLIRKDLHLFVKMLSKEQNIKDISLTTNGYFLDKYAAILKESGLKRVTVSLDSLREDRFNSITRRKLFSKIYNNILSLKNYSFDKIKINVVVIRDFNEDEIVDFINFGKDTGYIIRFIEFMPLDSDGKWSESRVVTSDEILSAARKSFNFVQLSEYSDFSPAQRYSLADERGEFGIIPSVSNPFCTKCGRIRLTADGYLRTCLFSLYETGLKKLIRGGAGDNEIAEIIKNALLNKEEGHMINKASFRKPRRPMYQIGG